MIERYTRAPMAELWSLPSQYGSWLEVELHICEALAARGHIPAEAASRMRERARFDPARIAAIEERVRHDVAAFVENVGESLGEDARWLHWGVTSSDVLDTALAWRLRRAGDLLLEGADRVLAALASRARRHRDLPTVGRTHGMHAEPTSFGLKFVSWHAEGTRVRARLAAALAEVAVGKVSGAVGNFAHLEPEVEESVCAALGLRPDPASTQVVARDRHAAFLAAIALAGGWLERIAVEIRHLQRSEVGEVQEAFGEGQKGSSSMPHKRNPVVSERVTGMARLLRGYALAAMESGALWHERDISHSSAERVILPDATATLDFLLHDMAGLMEGLLVREEAVRANLERGGGLVYSQRVLTELVGRGWSREKAYRLTQELARAGYGGGASFRELALESAELRAVFPRDEIASFFDPAYYLRRVEAIYRRNGLA